MLRAPGEPRWALDEIETSGAIRTLKNRRMGIVGLGAIGLEVAQAAAGFGMRVSAFAAAPIVPCRRSSTRSCRRTGCTSCSRRATSSCCRRRSPPETRHLIGADALAHVSAGALLVNVGRGKLIDDEALVAALQDGRLGGAALDVFTREPLSADSPYWDLPNVIVTPHMSGAMEDYWTPLVALFAENLRRFERGEPLLNVVDKTAGILTGQVDGRCSGSDRSGSARATRSSSRRLVQECMSDV